MALCLQICRLVFVEPVDWYHICIKVPLLVLHTCCHRLNFISLPVQRRITYKEELHRFIDEAWHITHWPSLPMFIIYSTVHDYKLDPTTEEYLMIISICMSLPFTFTSTTIFYLCYSSCNSSLCLLSEPNIGAASHLCEAARRSGRLFHLLWWGLFQQTAWSSLTTAE